MLDKILNNIIVRLSIYYAASITFFIGFLSLFPQIPYYIARERDRQVGRESLDFGAGAASAVGESTQGLMGVLAPETSIPVLMGLVLSFVLTLPVTWVYRWTHSQKKYSQTFAHTLLVVPIAIASVVFLVKGSLALAFSLAGIVAAVRFRTSLNEPMDAVYMFIVIGIGLAAGIQLLNVAFISSVIFNGIAIAVWYTDFGAKPAVMNGCNICTTGKTGMTSDGVVKPNSSVEESNGNKPFNAQLLVHTTKVDVAREATMPILESYAKRWQLAPVIQKEDGTSIVVFEVRLKKSVTPATLVEEVERSDKKHIDKVEVKKHKTIKV